MSATSSRAWRVLPLLAFAVLLVLTAWINDDAYITFRTVDNFLNGYGLTWNVEERVQAYTHPLWMMLVTACVSMTSEYYVTVLALSFAIALATVAFVVFRLSRTTAAALGVGASLCLSKAFVEYSTSGLENPLTHLLIVLFALTWASEDQRPRAVLVLAATAGLCVLTRMDTALLFAPALAWTLVQRHDARTLAVLALGFAPMIAWEAFSIAYYGFPFPNTAYAKLATGIADEDLARQGLQYLTNALEMDPLTVAVIACGVILPPMIDARRHLPIALGIVLYLAYVLRVGGDFMMGRFLAAPFCAAVASLAQLDWKPLYSSLAVAGALVLSFVPMRPILLSGPGYGRVQDTSNIARNVGDQRWMYFEATGLLNAPKNGWEPSHPWVTLGRELSQRGRLVVVYPATGFKSFYAGPQVVMIDSNALSDPLLARLPADEKKEFVIAHFLRSLPDGYEDSMRADHNHIRDPDLAAYYDELRRVTRGPLWTRERWQSIWRLNTGALEPRIAAYVARRTQR